MGKHTPSGGSLKDYRSLLLKIVERIEDDVTDVKADIKDVKGEVLAVRVDDIPGIKVEIAEIKTEQRIKASMYGALGGGAATLVMGILLWWLDSQ